MGPSGSGQLTKMVNQICIAGLVQGLAEGINFSEKAGLETKDVIEVISQGAAQSWQMENRWETMSLDEYDHGFAVDHMRKDLKIAIEEAGKTGAHVEITKLIDGFYKDIQDMGGNRWDTSSLLKRLQKND
jgi:3-hydroxyisobutyrate dehydrogenase-like beta-hydroxyacid dehydrogenase